MKSGVEELANAIVMQAVKDWRDAVKKLKRNPQYVPAISMKSECERFFLSDWFTLLTDVDGTYILKKLKQEAGIHDNFGGDSYDS